MVCPRSHVESIPLSPHKTEDLRDSFKKTQNVREGCLNFEQRRPKKTDNTNIGWHNYSYPQRKYNLPRFLLLQFLIIDKQHNIIHLGKVVVPLHHKPLGLI